MRRSLLLVGLCLAVCAGAIGRDVKQELATALGRPPLVIPFQLTEPSRDTVDLRLDGRSVIAAPLWPNAAATSQLNFQGRWVGVGAARWDDFEGKDLRGVLAIVDFDCGSRWLRAFELGAVAVAFVPHGPIDRIEAESKFLQVPLRAPRFLIDARTWSSSERERALVGHGSAQARCSQHWMQRDAACVIGSAPGTQDSLSSARLLLVAASESSSIAPAWPGPEPLGARVMIELARRIRARPLPVPVDFALVDGHAMGLKGERALVQWLTRSKRQYVSVIGLELSSGSATLGVQALGRMVESRPESREVAHRLIAALRDGAVEAQIAPFIDAAEESSGRPWRCVAGAPIAIPTEPFLLAGLPAVSLITCDDARLGAESPSRLFAPTAREAVNESIQCDRIEKLLRATFANAGKDLAPAKTTPSIEPVSGSLTSLVAGFATVQVKAATFDPAKSFLPDVPVASAWVRLRGRGKSFCGVRGDYVEMSGANGLAEFVGYPTASSYWRSERQDARVDAFRSGADGAIELAAAQGAIGPAAFDRAFAVTTASKGVSTTLFQGASIAVYGAVDPLTGRSIRDAKLFERPLATEPREADAQIPWSIGEPPVIVAHRAATAPLDVAQFGDGADPVAVGTAPAEGLSSLLAAERMVELVDREIASAHGVPLFPESSLRRRDSAQADAIQARQAFEARHYALADRTARSGLAKLSRLYPELRATIRDLANGALFYLAALVPFAIAFERIALGRRHIAGRALGIAATFLGGAGALAIGHPAFSVTSSAPIVLIGFAMLSLSIMVGAFLLRKFDESSAHVGPERFRATGSWALAFDLACQGMRRRPLRTTLTALVATIMSFAILALTSLGLASSAQRSPTESTGPSAVIRDPKWAPLSEATVDDLAGIGAPVWWRYADGDRPTGTFEARSANQSVALKCLVGADRFGLADDEMGFAPSQFGAGKLQSGDAIEALGMRWKARLVDPAALGSAALPLDPSALSSGEVEAGAGVTRRCDPAEIGIVTASAAKGLGARPYLVVGERLSDAAATAFVETSGLTLVNGGPKGAERWSFGAIAQGSGGALALMAIGLAAVFMLNASIASAMERKREISSLSAIGMAPRAIGQIFLVEGAVYGLLGALFGFFLALVVQRAALFIPQASGLKLSFGSFSSALGALTVVAASVLSAIFPARMATKLAAPHYAGEVDGPESELLWTATLPLNVAPSDAPELLERFRDWLQAGQVPDATPMSTESINATGTPVVATVWLPPYELGVRQRVAIALVESEAAGYLRPTVQIERLGGDHASWLRANRRWLSAARQEALTWRIERASRLRAVAES